MSNSHCVLGVDGGGSKTTALLAQLDGRVLGRGTAGASNFQVIGHGAAQVALNQAIEAAFADAGLEPGAVSAFCLGLSGVDRPGERALFQDWAEQAMPGARVIVVNDAELALAAGTPADWGLALICGTGSIVYGRSSDGRVGRAGGWGHLLGDEGSGYAIGLESLRAVMRAFDGRGPATALTGAIVARWSLSAPPDLVARVYRQSAEKSDIAALASTVEAVAAQGDQVAQQIITEAGHELALAARAVIAQLNLKDAVPCALAGGVIAGGSLVRRAFEDAAARLGLVLAPLVVVREPAIGAIELARSLAIQS